MCPLAMACFQAMSKKERGRTHRALGTVRRSNNSNSSSISRQCACQIVASSATNSSSVNKPLLRMSATVRSSSTNGRRAVRADDTDIDPEAVAVGNGATTLGAVGEHGEHRRTTAGTPRESNHPLGRRQRHPELKDAEALTDHAIAHALSILVGAVVGDRRSPCIETRRGVLQFRVCAVYARFTTISYTKMTLGKNHQ